MEWGGESRSTVRELVKECGLTFPVLLDVERDESLEYYVRSIPATFLSIEIEKA